jgi:hypothetical protein
VGHELYSDPENLHLGSVSIRRWEEMSKLLPLLIDFVNRAMRKEWREGTVRDVRLLAERVTIPSLPAPDQLQPDGGTFSLERMLSEELLDINEIRISEAAEWGRLIAWCDFLAERDGAFLLYRPLVDVLRPYLADFGQ